MERLKQRFSKHSVLDDIVNDNSVQDGQEAILADDSDAFRQSEELSDTPSDMALRLKLSESDNNICGDNHTKDEFGAEHENISTTLEWESSGKGHTVFEIISADTVKEEGAKDYVSQTHGLPLVSNPEVCAKIRNPPPRIDTYVDTFIGQNNDDHHFYMIYRILLTQPSQVDSNPCIIEKRYSDFEKLHSDLKKGFGKKMDDISFPKKKLIGNFTPKTIGNRSRAFEQYLTHLYSLDELRFSQPFLQFFYLSDLQSAYNFFLADNFTDAMPLFQKVLQVQERIIGFNSVDIGITLCALVVSCQLSEKEDFALGYGLSALKCFKGKEDSVYYLPLLQTCIHLSWKLGKDKTDLEEILQKRKRESRELPSLLSILQGSVNI